ncbi:MAG TPA: S8 family serine peptidase [Trebonia sp.]|nr:S8 family serine peptidase [Trebonia sp.]
MTNVARTLRGLVPVLAAFAATAAAALPATAAAAPVTSRAVTRADEWWLTALGVPSALRAAPAAGKGVTVAVLSTGVDASHPDLADTVTAGPDLSDTGRGQGSPYWGVEGTAVASLIAGHGHGPGGTEGITGVAPDARILSLRVTLEYDDPLTSDTAITRHLPGAIAAGIRWAVGHGAAVIALPLDPGTLGPAVPGNPAAGGSAAEKAAVSFALAHDVLLVAPAGDNGAEGNLVNYPAAYPGVVAVGATTRAGQLSPFSSTRSYVALTAPGAGTTPDPVVSGGMTADPAAGLLVAAPDGGYEPLASTDMSAALTAGVAALIRSRYPWLTVPEVTWALERGVTALPRGARPAGSGPAGAGRGHGELNAAAALSSAAAVAAAHPAPAPSTAPPTEQLTATPPRPASTRPARLAAASPADPGHLLRSLVVDLAAAAGVLIACLTGAIALTGRRRARTGRSAGQGRHAKGQSGPPTAPVPARVAIWPAAPATSRPGGNAGSAWPDTTSSAGDSSQVPGTFGKPGGPPRRPQPGENPPWQPATPPRDPASPPAMLPAQTAAEKPGPPLTPWEQSPEDFAVAPPADDLAPWPVASTGPMYVWNPATATGPILVVNDNQDEDEA